jgi:hypothetical protein
MTPAERSLLLFTAQLVKAIAEYLLKLNKDEFQQHREVTIRIGLNKVHMAIEDVHSEELE